MPDPVRIGLLQLGEVHPEVAATTGDYPALFSDLLAGHHVDLVTYDVRAGQVPTDPAAHDGWLASGSASSAYEPLPWIETTSRFLLDVLAADVPLVAICFGHQLLAQALGGRVAKAEVGWGVGVHRYDLVAPTRPWEAPAPVDGVRVIASHQDQVVEPPEDIELLLTSEHCPVAGFTVEDRALAIQAHPEFTAEVSRGLVERRRAQIGAERADAALAGLDEPLDRTAVAAWMAAFWRRSA